MNVMQRPNAKEFCATMRDYIIDTDSTITFTVRYGNRVILEEEYVPDAEYKVRTRGLGKFCELALWGVWCTEEDITQVDAAGSFTFLINGVEDMTCFVMFSRLFTKKDAASPGVLSEVNRKVTYPGTKEYVSGFPIMESGRKGMEVTAYWDDDTEETKFVAGTPVGTADTVYTFDVSPDRICPLFGKAGISRYVISVLNGSMQFIINNAAITEKWCFRFKNVYDMPETLTITGGLSIAGNNESDTASMYGVGRKFGIKVKDEYTAKSGPIFFQSDYKLWHNLLNSQEVSILCNDEWLPVIITKQKFEREFKRSVLKAVEFNFTMANPEQNNLIEL